MTLPSVARRIHGLLGLVAVALAIAHLGAVVITRHGIKPYSTLGWLPEMSIIGLAALLPGAGMIVTAWRWKRTGHVPIGSTVAAAVMAAATFALFTRYFDEFDAGFSLAALVDGVLVSLAVLPAARQRALAGARVAVYALALAGVATFVCVSYLGRVDHAQIQETWQPRDPAQMVRFAEAEQRLQSLAAQPGQACAAAERALMEFAADLPERDALVAELSRIGTELANHPDDLWQTWCRGVIANLLAKAASGATLTTADLARRTLEFERFRLETWLSSGVAPRRYFGFFDEQGNTAAHERAMRQTIARAVPILNGYAAEQRLAARVSDQEIAVTFLAEGGALLLTERTWIMDRIHPVRGIGLDSFREVFARMPELVKRIDERFHTGLGRLLWRVGRRPILLRPMSFREAILGTAILYLYEKQLAASRLPATGDSSLGAQPPGRQFVAASLVYNSGISFEEERIDQLLAFSTADYLAAMELRNRATRKPLAVMPREEMLRLIHAGGAIPPQPTSWSAVFHVLQRYGAWVALQRYSDVFDAAGRFRARD